MSAAFPPEHRSNGTPQPLRSTRKASRVRLIPSRDRPNFADMKSLPIVWQRLVTSDGKTCDRCATTHQEIRRAAGTLEKVLHPLGIRPVLKSRKISVRSFKADPSESNRVWIAGRPIEEWLGGRVGASRCCSVCGPSPCRTVEVGGTVFETIPAHLFLKAALIAASDLLKDSRKVISRQRRKSTGRRTRSI